MVDQKVGSHLFLLTNTIHFFIKYLSLRYKNKGFANSYFEKFEMQLTVQTLSTISDNFEKVYKNISRKILIRPLISYFLIHVDY